MYVPLMHILETTIVTPGITSFLLQEIVQKVCSDVAKLYCYITTDMKKYDHGIWIRQVHSFEFSVYDLHIF